MKPSIAISVMLLGALCAGCNENPRPNGANEPSPRAEVVVVDESNFQDIVLSSDKPVLVDFWADW